MFSKMNIKQLASIFVVLLLLVFSVRFCDNKNNNNRSFKSELVEFTADDVATIVVHSRADFDNPLTYYKENDAWMVKKAGNDYSASLDVVNAMISTLTNMRAERVAANNKEKWAEYQVNDTTGTRVIVKNLKGKTLTDVYVGKFTYTQPQNVQQSQYGRQPQGKITSFVRLNNQKEVYAVDGYLTMAFDRDLKYVRESKILSDASTNWSKITVNHPGDSSFVLEKQDKKWLIDGMPADSASTYKFLKGIERLSSTNFYDDPVNINPSHTILIEGTSIKEPIEIKGYYIGDEKIFNSSTNPKTYFISKDDKIFEKLFARKPKQ